MNGLQVIEHNNARVITSKQLADVYGTDSKTIVYNFRYHKKRYTEGKHYFVLQGEELRAKREIHALPKNQNKLYLWTERGALLLAKSINTDVAWEAYERLVDFYFEKKPSQCAELTIKDDAPEIYNTSNAIVPKRESWLVRNNVRMQEICHAAGIKRKALYHRILVRLDGEYNLSEATRMFTEEIGEPPRHPMDIVSYFPELGRCADIYLSGIEKAQEQL